MRMTIASVLSHLVVRLQLFYKINENKSKRKINIDLAIVASQIPGGAIHDSQVAKPSALATSVVTPPSSHHLNVCPDTRHCSGCGIHGEKILVKMTNNMTGLVYYGYWGTLS